MPRRYNYKTRERNKELRNAVKRYNYRRDKLVAANPTLEPYLPKRAIFQK